MVAWSPVTPWESETPNQALARSCAFSDAKTLYGGDGVLIALTINFLPSTWYAAGILSFDKSCAVAEYGVYVRATDLKDWVQETMAKN